MRGDGDSSRFESSVNVDASVPRVRYTVPLRDPLKALPLGFGFPTKLRAVLRQEKLKNLVGEKACKCPGVYHPTKPSAAQTRAVGRPDLQASTTTHHSNEQVTRTCSPFPSAQDLLPLPSAFLPSLCATSPVLPPPPPQCFPLPQCPGFAPVLPQPPVFPPPVPRIRPVLPHPPVPRIIPSTPPPFPSAQD
ncbi:inverted formin-2-like [Scylla paramamosain]|uniref:inverted formin-2-like n=1 Tax=Scylla paramamosain TaxID=85552 RepID=UPI003083636A